MALPSSDPDIVVDAFTSVDDDEVSVQILNGCLRLVINERITGDAVFVWLSDEAAARLAMSIMKGAWLRKEENQ